MNWNNKFWERSPIQVQTKMEQPIFHFSPHYTDNRFSRAQTVFLRNGYHLQTSDLGLSTVKEATYIYSDRIPYSDQKRAREELNESDHNVRRTAAYNEKYLRIALNNPSLRLVHILAGYHLANGWPIQVFGIIEKTDDNS